MEGERKIQIDKKARKLNDKINGRKNDIQIHLVC